jgi:chromosome segregation ATPase
MEELDSRKEALIAQIRKESSELCGKQLEESSEKIKVLSSQASTQEKRIRELNEMLAKEVENSSAKSSTIKQKMDHIEELNEQLELLQMKLKNSEKALNELMDSHSAVTKEIRAQLEGVREEHRKAKLNLSKGIVKEGAMQQEVDLLTESNTKLEAEIRGLKRQIEDMQSPDSLQAETIKVYRAYEGAQGRNQKEGQRYCWVEARQIRIGPKVGSESIRGKIEARGGPQESSVCT